MLRKCEFLVVVVLFILAPFSVTVIHFLFPQKVENEEGKTMAKEKERE